MGRVATHPGERVLRKVERQGDCLLFTGRRNASGYGRTTVSEGGVVRDVLAHRAVYEYLVGPIPEGAWILHSCDVRACVNFEHLRPGTPLDNSTDMVERGRQRKPMPRERLCINGHEMNEENSFEKPSPSGVRYGCRICQRRSIAKSRGYDPDAVGPHNRDKTHCKRGHEFTPESTYINPTSGGRQCMTCVKEVRP